MNEAVMRVSKEGRITIPKQLRDLSGLHPETKVELLPTSEGLLLLKREEAVHPVDRVAGILDRTGGPAIPIESVDE